MKVSSIQSYSVNGLSRNQKRSRMREQLPQVPSTAQGDTVSFKGKAAIGATIGGILGAAAITFISGGAAIPFVIGAYTVGGATLGAGVGEALNDDDKNNKNED